MEDTIFALSSGMPPAAIAIVRMSGPAASATAERLAGQPLTPRQAHYSLLTAADGTMLDRAIIITFPGPDSATGEDLAELHLHGGRAVVQAVQNALSGMTGLRAAEAGEFTRRAFANGRIDLGQAEALSDLLSAETEWQRRAAADMMGSRFSRSVEAWRQDLLSLSASVEAELDFSDEEDVAQSNRPVSVSHMARTLAAEVRSHLSIRSADRLRDGIRVVLAGPPNSGKSSLLNGLVLRDAAIVSDIAGTTRDIIEVPVALQGLPFLFSDTAGLRASTTDVIEAAGIARAGQAMEAADIILWLGEEGHCQRATCVIEVAAKSDLESLSKSCAALSVSAKTGDGMRALVERLCEVGRTLIPGRGDFSLNERQKTSLHDAAEALEAMAETTDALILAEYLRLSRLAFDRLTGRSHTEELLDHIFAGFCIGK